MDNSFDLGAFTLYLIFGSVLFYLIYLLFDIRNIFGRNAKHEYMIGHPENEEFEPSEGVLEVKGNEIVFKELSEDKVYFSIPIGDVNNVSTARGGASFKNRVFGGISNLFAERDYLFIDFFRGDKEHTLQFSTHRTSSANDKVIKEIREAKKKILGQK